MPARLNSPRVLLALISGLALLVAACTTAGPAPEAERAPAPGATPAGRTPAPLGDDELRTARLMTEWRTDFSRHSVPLGEITSGGPPRDGIPSIDEPRFIDTDEADEWLDDREPVQVVNIEGDVRAYPVQILMWHEIVNDEVGGTAVAVTYCPLCNTAIVFERTLPEVGVVEFGTTGNLYRSALVMYDRETESWFWQVSGEAIVGALTGARLALVPSALISWGEFKRAHPESQVLSRDTGYTRRYGDNPYRGYDTGTPFLFDGDEDARLSAMERVATVELDGEAVAFPFSVLIEEPVVHHILGSREIVVLYREGTASPLDAGALAEGRDVGSTGVFIPVAGGQMLTFERDGDEFRDRETGSTWNLLGEAIDGALRGERLEPLTHGNHFWFVWAVYQPETEIYGAGE